MPGEQTDGQEALTVESFEEPAPDPEEMAERFRAAEPAPSREEMAERFAAAEQAATIEYLFGDQEPVRAIPRWDRLPLDRTGHEWLTTTAAGYLVEVGVTVDVEGRDVLVDLSDCPLDLVGDPSARRAIVDVRVKHLRDALVGLDQAAPKAPGVPLRIAIVNGPCPLDGYYAVEHQRPGFTADATGGAGEIVFWSNGSKPVQVHTLIHEYGHVLSEAVFGPDNEDARAVTEEEPRAVRIVRRFRENWNERADFDAAQQSAPGFSPNDLPVECLRRNGFPARPSTFPNGITEYGQTNLKEDFAESVALFLRDKLEGGLKNATGERVRFALAFPGRTDLLRRLTDLDESLFQPR